MPQIDSELLNQKYVDVLVDDARFNAQGGKVADYIPELRMALRSKTGISVHFGDGREPLRAGAASGLRRTPEGTVQRGTEADEDNGFTIQSISKVFALLYVLEEWGEEMVFKRVGKEPTGEPFNADPKIRAEGDVRMPYNPMINVGAIFITSLFPGTDQEHRFAGFFEFVRKMCGDDSMVVDEDVYASEKATGHNNRSLAWKMSSDGIFLRSQVDSHPKSRSEKTVITADLEENAAQAHVASRTKDVDFVENVLDCYFRQCSIVVTCDHLAHAAAILARGGLSPSGDRVVRQEHVENVVSIMSSCGLYDGSGEFAYTIGIPGKSGVGGGIMCVVPGLLGVATFSPALDPRGNSVRGIYMLNHLSRRCGLHLFHRQVNDDPLRTYGSAEALFELVEEVRYSDVPGHYKPADYIPELSNANAQRTGIALCLPSGELLSAGDCRAKFSLQSIANVFALLYVLNVRSEGTVFRFVGKEASGESYDKLKWKEIVEAEDKRLVPFNPMINAGSIAIAAMIPRSYQASADGTPGIEEFLDFVRRICGNPTIAVNQAVYESERTTGFNNRSLAWLMNDKRAFNQILASHVSRIDNRVLESILSVYFRMCSIEVDCEDLARFAAVLACGGREPRTGRPLVPAQYVRIAASMMCSSGLYNGSGDFAYRVGVPAKSGVSGGLVGVVPGRLGMAAYSSIIDEKGTSYRGDMMFEAIARTEGLSIFSRGAEARR